MTEVKRRDSDWTYSIDGEEKRLPGVTTVLKAIIQPYGPPGGGNGVNAHLLRARARGKAVHRLIEIIEGAYGGNLIDMDPRLVPYRDGYRAFKKLTGFEPIDFEVAVAHPQMGYGGMLDTYGTLWDKPAILDIKTGTPPWWCNLQTAAYAAALEQTIGGSWATASRYCLWLRDTGDFKPIEYPDTMDIHKFNAFLSCYHQMADAKALKYKVVEEMEEEWRRTE